MDRQVLINKLDSEFNFKNIPERDWIGPMSYTKDYLTVNFKKYQNGEVFHFTDNIEQIYLSTFASETVVNKILKDGKENSLLVVHHPLAWVVEGSQEDRVPYFVELPEDLIVKMREAKISLYSLHIPLDKVGEYSTSFTFSEAFSNKDVIHTIYNYFGVYVGVIGKVEYKSVNQLQTKFEDVIGHKVSVYRYGEENIKQQKVGFVGGAGLKDHVMEELHGFGVNTYCTGITMNTLYNKAAHDLAKKYQINILGGTHYSTEKFAPMKLSKLFESYGLPSRFIDDQPNMKDIDI